jgi:hypothetical protein
LAEHHPDEHARRWSLLSDEVRRRLGPGAPLAAPVRTAFEGRLGGDLSGAMVHRSPLAGRLARSLGAAALTAGEHVLGDDEALDTETAEGAGLLGHELSHVVQRDSDGSGEAVAQVVERVIGEQPVAPMGAANPEELAEKVYQRLLAELWRERDRGAWTI